MKVFYDLDSINRGGKKRIGLDFERYPHMLICGATGSGKTIASKLILGKISRNMKDACLYLCDYKNGIDFKFLRGNERFYGGYDCIQGIRDAHARFHARQHEGDEDRSHVFLFIDEYATFLRSFKKKDKADLEEVLSMVQDFMMLGRELNCHLIISLQRPDSDYFSKGSRDNFTLRLALGKLSPELIRMVFEDGKESIVSLGRGKGYLDVDGEPLQTVVVPYIPNPNLIDDDILEFINRGGGNVEND
ncbi:ATP-binding protein [Bacillus toyonensis]|uniref:ATP-binding protein n=1 Tax=Bacillus toyonensis TaxID=155322 RepID=UPI001C0DB474|nr:hypothetical protein [Bacillus toyonensis]MBU4643155.1 hypothetical protein [Bacillus toyonensis]